MASKQLAFAIIFCLFKANEMAAEKQLIVLSLPEDKYYKNSWDDIAQFVKDFASAAGDKDDVMVLFPSKFATESDPNGGFDFGDAYVLHVDQSLDLWMRDFGLIASSRPVKFLYRPDYLSRSDARYVENEFRKFLSKYGKFEEESSMSLDGGNVVDNGIDKAIVTDRFYYENPNERGKVYSIFFFDLQDILPQSPEKSNLPPASTLLRITFFTMQN